MKKSQRLEQQQRDIALKEKLSQLDCLSNALNQAYRSFNFASDPVIMDACIFEINALRNRRSCVLNEIRAFDQEHSSSS